MVIFKNKKHQADASGFTLIEIMIVLFIVSVGLVGVLGLIVQNIQSHDYNRSNLVAYQLAQEGIELVRNARDNNWRASRSFMNGLEEGLYIADYQDEELVPYDGLPDSTELHIDSNGFYVHDLSAKPSGFSRIIKISEGPEEKSFKVNSLVTWFIRDREYSYNLEVIFYDWYPL